MDTVSLSILGPVVQSRIKLLEKDDPTSVLLKLLIVYK